jgi:thymidylate kinase
VSRLIIDFFGSPGAGKTHVSQAIAEYLRDRGIKTLVLREILFPKRYSREWLASRCGTLLWTARHPVYTWRLRAAISASRQQSPADRRRFRLAWIRTLERIDRLKSQYQIILVDHGLAQLLWSIGYGGEPSTWSEVIERFGPLMKLSDLTIVVKADAAIAMNRLERRSKQIGATSRIQKDNLNSDQALAIVDRLRSDVIRVLESGADSACRLFTFNNDGDDDNTADIEQLAKAIEYLLETETDCPAKTVSAFLKQSPEAVLPACSISRRVS